MISLQKGDLKQNLPSFISFASPIITPSNNYKKSNVCQDFAKEANSSIIMGRKIDSPQLKLGKDLNELPQTSMQDNRRQLSQSATHKNQNQIAIASNTAQPLINLQISNVKMGKQPKLAQQMKKQMELKIGTGQQQVIPKNKHRKNKSEVKTSKGLSKSSLVNHQKRHHNREQMSAFQEGFMFGFENKENQNMNILNKRELTPNANQRTDISLSSINSDTPQKMLCTSGLSQCNKKCFMDKSSFLKHLSPEKSETRPQRGRVEEPEVLRDLKSNISTNTHQQTKKKNFKIIKRIQNSQNNQQTKVFVKGVDKIIKENLKKNKSKEEEEIIKKYLEDYKQKQKRVELSQRNQEVRKINASKIISNHQHKHSNANQMLQFQNLNYKKQRSQSCMNQTDNIFVNMQKKENKTHAQVQQQHNAHPTEDKKERKREKSFVLEMKELKKEIDQEIKKEIQEGKLDITSATNQKANLYAINHKKVKEENQKSKEDIIYHQTRQRKKSKHRESLAINQKIQKFIDKKKKAQLAKKSMEQTLAEEKHLKIKENLHNLNKFVKQHFRHQSQNIFLKNFHTKKEEKIPQRKLKPHFYKLKKAINEGSKFFNLDGEFMYEHQVNDSNMISPGKNLDLSELNNDYQVMLKAMIAKAKKQKINQKRKKVKQSFSAEPSPGKSRSNKRINKILKMKLKIPRAEKQQEVKEIKVKLTTAKQDGDYSPDYKRLLKVIKNEVVAKIPEDQVASLIPPQSDIATMEHRNKDQNSEIKSQSRKIHNINQVSPKAIEQIKKQKVFIQKYGQLNESQSDTKFLIKLHSAAITIQQQYREHLARRGFYDEGIESQLYVDSELEGDFNYQLESGYQMTQLRAISLENSRETTVAKSKQVQEQKRTSPLRIKNSGQKDAQKDTFKFYAEGNNNSEKVIVCSVINTGRPEDDDSLHNTQQYIPLRQKIQKPFEMKDFNVEKKLTSYFIDVDQSSSSQRKNLIPSLDLDKLKVKEEKKSEDDDAHSKEGSARNIFERNPFQEFSSKVHSQDFNMDQYPELLKLREDAIRYKEQTEQKYINKMYKAQQLSPRTYEKKRHELEMWVTSEREEVKKSRKVFEKQWQQASYMIEQTQKDQDMMKKIMIDSGRISLPSKRDHELLSHRILSSRREPTLLDMIYDNKEQGKTLEKQQEDVEAEKKKQKEIEEQKIKKAHEEEQKKKQEEIQRQKDIIEKRKRQEEQERLDKLEQQREKERSKKEKEDEEKKKEEAQKRAKEDQIKKQREEVERRRKEEEEIQRQKDLELKKKQDNIAKLKREEEERLKIIKEQQNKEVQEKQRLSQQKEQQKKDEEKLKKEQREERERKNYEIQRKLDSINQKFRSRSPQQTKPVETSSSIESLQKTTKNIKDDEDELKSEPDLDMIDDQKRMISNENQLINQILRAPSKKTLDEVNSDEGRKQASLDKIDEPSRGLSRTRSSQDLKDNKEASLSEENKEQSDIEEVTDMLKKGLNERSVDEDPSTKAQQNRNLNEKNFFTKNFDYEKAEDLFEKFKNSSSEMQQIINANDTAIDKIEEESKESNQTQVQKSNKIYIEDKGEEIVQPKQNPFIQPSEIRSKRLPHVFKNKIPVDEEEKFIPAMPVSPASQEGIDLRIYTGSQSLESTLSDEKKLKQAISEISKQDKLDEKEHLINELTEDIFKALMTEMKLELDLILIRDPRTLVTDEEQHQNFFSESGKYVIIEGKGIKTDLFAIEKYVEEVLEEVLRDKNRFIININTPLSKQALEVLNQLQNSEIGSYEHFETNYPHILPLDMYLKLEKRRKESRERERKDREEDKDVDKNFLAECEHIHNKVLFDCINDSLLQFKPYGKDGFPLPWSRQSRRLKPIEDFTIEEMFEIVKHDLFRWAIMQAGTLPRKEFFFGGFFDEELFAEIKEKKLATLLAREIIENEPKWLQYEFEEAQAKIDIGDMILDQLVTETINILNNNIEM